MTRNSGSYRKSFAVLMAVVLFFICFQISLQHLAAQTRLANPSKPVQLASRGTRLVQASFKYGPTLPVPGQEVQFTDASTGNLTSWQWDFGDGTFASDRNPSHTYAEEGFYRVTLTVGNASSSRSRSRIVTVSAAEAKVEASFVCSPSFPTAGQAVRFEGTSAGSSTSWMWDISEGSTSADQKPKHAFLRAGFYNVTLTVTNGAGSSSLSRIVTVSPASTLSADFVFSPDSPVLGQIIQFSDRSSGSPDSWLWEFGDGVSDTISDPSHAFAAAGSYVVTLTVKAGSDSSSTSRTVKLTPTNVIAAASPSLEDVSAAISSAGSGDTIIVPPGAATWDQQLVLTKGVKIIGAGVGKTVITSGYMATTANTTNPGNALIYYRPAVPSDSEKFRLSGFTFDLNNMCGLLHIKNGSATAIRYNRIDSNLIKNTIGYRTIIACGTIYGVIDSNTMDNVGNVLGSYGINSTSWAYLTFDFGTADNLYFEDNVITGLKTTPHSGGAGGRYCVRHNSYTSPKTTGLYPWYDMHGNQPSGNHAIMGAEIYENTVTMTEAGKGVGIFDHRGGKAVIYNNTAITTGSVSQKCREEYNDGSKLPATGPDGQPQHVSDSYYWGNRKNGATLISASISQTVNYGGDKGFVPQENREFWNEKASFDGTPGIGVGLFNDRPNSGAKGLAYWATDKKILYRCTADNSWEAYYTPYTYPHPLRNKF